MNEKKEKTQPMKETTGASVYPYFPVTESSSVAEVSDTKEVTKAVHTDPRIQVAPQAMINMGFNNEGGWLTNLLEVKDGDIGKVLDILQPVRKAEKKIGRYIRRIVLEECCKCFIFCIFFLFLCGYVA